jgi:hypothetical protein
MVQIEIGCAAIYSKVEQSIFLRCSYSISYLVLCLLYSGKNQLTSADFSAALFTIKYEERNPIHSGLPTKYGDRGIPQI